jgi:hypothetical protein
MGGAPQVAMRVTSQIWQIIFASQTLQVFCFCFANPLGFSFGPSQKGTICSSETRSCHVALRLGLKEFFYACVKKFTVYIWSLAMKRNFFVLGHNCRKNMQSPSNFQILD